MALGFLLLLMLFLPLHSLGFCVLLQLLLVF
jgi:hypothetical protein